MYRLVGVYSPWESEDGQATPCCDRRDTKTTIGWWWDGKESPCVGGRVSRSFGTTLIFVPTRTNPGLARRSSGGLEKSVLAYAQDDSETGQKAWPFFQSR
jgi:hypothetical protein